MQRLRVLEQHVVGDVDDVVDRPHPAGAQAALHPVRARTDLDSLDHAADVAAAQGRIRYRNLDQVASRRTRAAGERRHEVPLERAVEAGRQLARDAEVAHLVRPVGGDLRLHEGLARDHGCQRITGPAAVEDEDLFFRVVATEEQLVGRAQHPAPFVARDIPVVLDQRAVGHRGARQCDGDERPWNRVGRARDDLLRLAADVDLVDPQVVA